MQARGSRSLGAHTRPSAVAVLTGLAVVSVFVVALLPSPYAVEQPGPVYDTLGSSGTGKDRAPLISIPGERTYPTTGRLDLLTVSVLGAPAGGPSWFDLAEAWLDPAKAVIPLEAVFPRGETQQQAEQQSAAQMTGSQRSAIIAALTHLGYRIRSSVTVAAVRPGAAAEGVLRTGDVISSFAGEAVHDGCALSDAVTANGARRATMSIERGGQARTVRIAPTVLAGSGIPTPVLGVNATTDADFPFAVDLRIDDVGGPSAGMMFALGIVDKLTPGSLTGGRHVAGTGTICGDGQVGAIGGIVQKMAAARAAGATLFLAPASNCQDVVGHIPSGLDVVAVDTLSDSIEALEHVRDQGSARGLPTCSTRVSSAG